MQLIFRIPFLRLKKITLFVRSLRNLGRNPAQQYPQRHGRTQLWTTLCKKKYQLLFPSSSDNWRLNSLSDQRWDWLKSFPSVGERKRPKMAVWNSKKKTFFKREIVFEAILLLLRIQWVCVWPPLAAYFNLQLRREIKSRHNRSDQLWTLFRMSF